MSTKPIVDMSDEELMAEIERLQSFKVPAAPTAKAPKRPTTEGKRKKAKWKEDLGL